ncbi:hypothetical protein K438DRAFT_1870377, partial [Mycena galopus ATCC 62051]
TQRFLQRRFFFIHAPCSIRSSPHPLLMLLIRPLNASHIHVRRPRRTPVAHTREVVAPHTHLHHLRTPVAHTRQSPTTHVCRARTRARRPARHLDCSAPRSAPRRPTCQLHTPTQHSPTSRYPATLPGHTPLAERLNCQPPTSPPRVADLRTRRRCQLDAPLPRHLRCKPNTALAIPRALLPPRLPATRPPASTGLTLSLLRTHIYVTYHTLRHHPPVLPLCISLLLSLLRI